MGQDGKQRGRPRLYSDVELLELIRQFHAGAGRPPTMVEFNDPERKSDYPSAGTYVKRFGSWANAIEAAGFDRPKRGPRRWYKR